MSTISKDYFFYEEIFSASTINPDIILTYTSFLSIAMQKRANRQNNPQMFSEFIFGAINYPFYLITKLVNASKTILTSSPLSSFFTFLQELTISPNLSLRVNHLFSVFDFDNDDIVHIEDIKYLIKHVYILHYQTKQYLSELNSVLEHCGIKGQVNREQFKSIIMNTNSDLFYLFLTLIDKGNPYNKKYLNIMNDNQKGKRSAFSNANNMFGFKQLSLFNFPNPNIEVVSFINKAIYKKWDLDGTRTTGIGTALSENELENYIDFDEELEENIKLLNDFEISVSSAISNAVTNLRESLNLSNNSLNNHLDMSINPIKASPHTNSSRSCNTVSNISKHTLPSLSISGSKLDSSKSDYSGSMEYSVGELKVRKFTRNGTFEKAKVVIQDNLMYLYFRQRNKNWKIKAIYLLNKTFGVVNKSESINSNVSGNNKEYYKLELHCNTAGVIYSFSVFSSKKSKLTNLLQMINHNINIQNINDHYSLQYEINQGSFGKIYLGIQKETGKKVAIKKLKTSIPHQGAIWEREIFNFLKIISPNNIVECIDSFHSLNYYYLIYEYLPYGTLRNFIEQKSLFYSSYTFKYSKNLLLFQLISSLNELKQYGIIHRDIKPDNLLIYFKDEYISLKLTDFGLSTFISPTEKVNDSYGSLAYSSPEIINCEMYSHEPDVWSFGMNIFFILLGLDPYKNTVENIEEARRLISLADVTPIISRVQKCETFYVNIMKECFKKEGRISIEQLYSIFIDKVQQ